MSHNLKKEDLDLITSSLDIMKEEALKRSDIYKYGVDLDNYENLYYDVSINLIVHLLGGFREEVEWWLHENVEKKYSHNNGAPDVLVEDSRDFVNYIINHLSI
jgi:hypothetical protein